MPAKRTEYQIVGRYMHGAEVTAYHLQSIDTGKQGRYTREQVAYLVGRDQVTNCTGQIYGDKLILRGKGMSLEDLPVKQEDGALSKTGNIGKVKKGTSAADAMTQFLIVGTLKSGRNTVGYIIQNAGCGTKRVKRAQVLELARQGKIGNARVQMYNGKELLRGIGCSLDELPSETIKGEEGTPAPQKAPQKASTVPKSKTVDEKNEQMTIIKAKIKEEFRREFPDVYSYFRIGQDMSGRYDISILIDDGNSKLTGSFTRSYIASLNGTKKSYGSYENALNSLAVDIINTFHKMQNNNEINNKFIDKSLNAIEQAFIKTASKHIGSEATINCEKAGDTATASITAPSGTVIMGKLRVVDKITFRVNINNVETTYSTCKEACNKLTKTLINNYKTLYNN